MNKKFSASMLLTAFLITATLVLFPVGSVFAQIADGSYEINYEMKESGSDSTSIADGYFSKPATLTVKDGVQYIQLTVTSSDMIKSLSTPNGPVEVVSEGDDTRVVKFRVDGDLSKPLNMEMHIVVPDLYDTTHTARAVFDVSGLPSPSETSTTTSEQVSGGSGDEVTNPQTGDRTPIALYVTLLLGSIAIFTVYKLRVARD